MPTSSQALILCRTDSGLSALYKRTPRITPFPVSRVNFTGPASARPTVISKSEQFSTKLLDNMSNNGFRGVLSFDPIVKSFRWQLLPDPSEVKSTRPRFSSRKCKSSPLLDSEPEDFYEKDEHFGSSDLRGVTSSKSNNLRRLEGLGFRTSSTIIEDFEDSIKPWDFQALGQHERLANALHRPGSARIRPTPEKVKSHTSRPPSARPQSSTRRPPSARTPSPPGRSGRPRSPNAVSGRPQSGRSQSGRPQSGRPQSGRPQSGRPRSGRSQSPSARSPSPPRPRSPNLSNTRPTSGRARGGTVKHKSAPALVVGTRTAQEPKSEQGNASQKVAIPSVASRYQLSWKPGVSTAQNNADTSRAGFASLQETSNQFTRSLSRSRRTQYFRHRNQPHPNLTPSQEQLLYEEAKKLHKRKKVKLPSVRMRRVLPSLWPEALCFSTKKQGHYTHEAIKSIVEDQAHSPVETIQFDPVYVHLGTDNNTDTCIWVFSMNNASVRKGLMENGLMFEGGKVRVRRYDDVLDEEYQAYRMYSEVAEEQRRRKIIQTPRRASDFKKIAPVSKSEKHVAFTG